MIKITQTQYPRYTQTLFPDYRYIPGENPHPTEHPHGHSFGKKADKPERLTLVNWQKNETYLFGIDLYNYAYWWESHEAWESLWRQFPKESLTADYLQGLIKISAAFLKWHGRNQNGLDQLYSSGVEHLLKVCQESTVFMGVNLMEHIAKLSEHFRVAVADHEQWPDPCADYPFILLEKTEKC